MRSSSLKIKLRLSSICLKTDVVFYLTRTFRSSSIYLKRLGCLPFASTVEVVFHLPKGLRLSSILQKIRSSSILKIEFVFYIPNILGRLPFSQKLMSSSICPKIEVVFQFGSYNTHVRLLGQPELS